MVAEKKKSYLKPAIHSHEGNLHNTTIEVPLALSTV